MTKREAPAVPAHERLRVGLLLAFAGGFLEVYTYRLHGKVFANAQTGNMALFAIYAMQGDKQALYYLVPIGAFLAGVVVSEALRDVLTRRQWARWEHALVLAEAAVLAAIAFLPAGVPDAAVNVTVSFVCAVQFSGFRKTHGMAYATTFCTGNLRSAGEHLYRAAAGRDRGEALAAARYFGVILVFILGACCAMALVALWGAKAILLCSGLCLAAWALMKWG